MKPSSNPRPRSCGVPAALFVGVLLATAGCASDKPNSPMPAAREDVKELRQITADSIKAVKVTLRSLDRVSAQVPCPPRVSDSFARDIQRLEVQSFKMRAHAQAIRARGQAYFDQWHEHLAALHDPKLRKRAVERHDLLQQSFDKIRDNAQQARAAFQPFMSGLHRLRNALVNDPSAAASDAKKNLIRTTRENGQKVAAGLDAIQNELKTVADTLKQAKLSQ